MSHHTHIYTNGPIEIWMYVTNKNMLVNILHVFVNSPYLISSFVNTFLFSYEIQILNELNLNESLHLFQSFQCVK